MGGGHFTEAGGVDLGIFSPQVFLQLSLAFQVPCSFEILMRNNSLLDLRQRIYFLRSKNPGFFFTGARARWISEEARGGTAGGRSGPGRGGEGGHRRPEDPGDPGFPWTVSTMREKPVKNSPEKT